MNAMDETIDVLPAGPDEVTLQRGTFALAAAAAVLAVRRPRKV